MAKQLKMTSHINHLKQNRLGRIPVHMNILPDIMTRLGNGSSSLAITMKMVIGLKQGDITQKTQENGLNTQGITMTMENG